MSDCKCNTPEIVKVSFYSEKYDDMINSESIQDMERASLNSACVDIRCSKDVIIHPYQTEKISTGLYVSIPDGYEMQIRPRSGISAKTSLIFKNTIGTIDSDYRGREIFVLWYNLGVESVTFKKGDRIAQAKIERVLPVVYEEVHTIEDLKKLGNDRGGGFGHSGLK
jgi:dUTP pyrophosphatase